MEQCLFQIWFRHLLACVINRNIWKSQFLENFPHLINNCVIFCIRFSTIWFNYARKNEMKNVFSHSRKLSKFSRNFLLHQVISFSSIIINKFSKVEKLEDVSNRLRIEIKINIKIIQKTLLKSNQRLKIWKRLISRFFD